MNQNESNKNQGTVCHDRNSEVIAQDHITVNNSRIDNENDGVKEKKQNQLKKLMLTPASVRVLDYTNKKDIEMFEKATERLNDNMRFDLDPIKLKMFLNIIRVRANIYGWTSVLQVQRLNTQDSVNILESYGTISMEECRNQALQYTRLQDRRAQNSAMLYHFLRFALTLEAFDKLRYEKDKYTILDNLDGLCFLKLILCMTQLAMGTVWSLREEISMLDTKILEFSGDIPAFHQYVRLLTSYLDSYGEVYPELVFCLLKAYKMIPSLRMSIQVLEVLFRGNPSLYNARAIMSKVENEYKNQHQSDTKKPKWQNGDHLRRQHHCRRKRYLPKKR